ncbi:MAG: class I SAM-dependent methyltransferase [Sphingomicrobium sp.]
MTPFERALRERIAADGPISVEAYMEACNTFYYATRDPLGVAGDFTTAPEMSQLFGEMIGAALADNWRRAGSPPTAIFAELGPGRGTLAADALRVLRPAGFEGAAHLVETSPALRVAQQSLIPDAAWHDAIDELPDAPLLLVANEFLDALPIRQFVGGIERRVVIAGGGLAFDRDGETVEQSPARSAAVQAIARNLVQSGGVAILVDYGHGQSGVGDTLQAVREHGFSPLLANPGEQDLTAHVDFEAVAGAALGAGAAATGLASQGDWLRRLGIGERAMALIRHNPHRAQEIELALSRLTGAGAMGELFKVMALSSPDWPAPAGFAA